MSKTLGLLAAVIGIGGAIIAVANWLMEPTPAVEILLIEEGAGETLVNADANPVAGAEFAITETLTVDGVKLEAAPGALYVANSVKLVNGGTITGKDFAVVATVLEGGKLSASGPPGGLGSTGAAGPTRGMDAGRIVVAAARIDNTEIAANGGKGGDGAPGTDGSDGAAGSNGRNGKCKKFGGWKKAQPGGNGGPGGDGGNGQTGAPGGAGGDILVVVSEQPPRVVSAVGGKGGTGGPPGRYGQGGAGGTGGAGCTGLGGSQSSRNNGAAGPNGSPGLEGQSGPDGRNGTSTVRAIYFGDVKRAFDENRDNPGAFLAALRALRPD